MVANAVTTHNAGRRPMEEVVIGLRSKSDKIRALAREGYSRAEIARYLDIRYQHVRNVLVDEERSTSARRRSAATVEDIQGDARAGVVPDRLYPTKTRLEAGGRVLLPPEFWRAAGLKENESVVVSIDGDAIRLMSLPASIRHAQALVRSFVPEGVSLVDELLMERREEAKRESDDA